MNYGPKMRFIQEAEVFKENKHEKTKKVKLVKARLNEDLIIEKHQNWKLIEFGLQTLAVGLFQMEKRFFFLPLSIARIKTKFSKNFKMKGICSIGRVELNNKGLSSFAGGSVKILDNKNNIMMLIEGVIARRFEEKKNKNEKKINFKEKINKGLFNKEATQYRLFPISAESRDSLRDLASKLSEYVKKKNPKLDEMSNTLLSRHKNNQRFRAFVLARDLNELNKGLIKIANNEDIIENSVNNDENLAVFFSPQGVQFPGMFLTERHLFPSLNNKLVDICKQLGSDEEHFNQLINYLMDNEEKDAKNKKFSKNLSSSPSLIQCALFAIYQSLWIFLSEICNFKQIIFFGHSFGELSALCAAGAFNLYQGMKLLWKRGELIERTEQAKMLMIRHERKENLPLPQDVHLSARLSPTVSVYVGNPSIIEKLADQKF
ncbi:hypothetical protein ACQ4LE_011048, partial [Meloidogyne hapla]